MEYIREILGANLLALRKSKDLKQVELANLIGVTPASYNRWENGGNWPDPESLEKLATFYNVPSSRFFYDPGLDKAEANSTWVNRPSPKEITKKLEELIQLINP